MSNLINFISDRWHELLTKSLEHLMLTSISTAFAIVIGVPLAVWLVRRPRVQQMVMAVIGVLQTIPSLAMLAFLLPLFGIGALPALIALTLYALLPIVRNTITALDSVPADIQEATQALGFTRTQRLWKVELPLGLPIIIAGIRTAVVIGVGVATLAAFIGAGGLGDFIIRGLAVNSTSLILLGAIPAALLAVSLDFLIQRIEHRLSKQPRNKTIRSKQTIIYLIASIGLVVLIAISAIQTSEKPDSIRIGSKNFTEQFILGELIAQMLEAHTEIPIERKFNLGSVVICHQAMLNGELDIYPEYTGTAYRVILEQTDNLSPSKTYQQVKTNYQERFNLNWLTPFGFNDTYAVAIRESFAIEHNISKISQLSTLDRQLTMGFAAEFYERADGYPGLIKTYGLQFGETAEMELSLLYQAVRDEAVDVISGNSTDGRIQAYNLRILEDDLHFFPPYFAAPIVRNEVIKQHPEIQAVLGRLADRISEEQMQAMNYAVDHQGQSAYEVADSFLRQQGLKP